MRFLRILKDDEGLSLAELLVVLALMGMLLTAAYMGITLASRSGEIQRRDDYIARNLTGPLQVMDVVLSQNLTMNATADGYSFDCLTDQDNNNTRERHVFLCTTDGRLVQTVYSVTATGVQTLTRTTVWQTSAAAPPQSNANRLRARPLITYYRRDPITGAIANATAGTANEALITLEVMYNGAFYSDSRRVLFRNR